MSSALVEGVMGRALENKKKNLAAAVLQGAVRATNVMVEKEAIDYIIKKVKVADLLSLVKILKAEGGYTGRTSGLKKADLVNILRSVNYDFRNLASAIPKPVQTVPYRKYGSLKKAVERYEKSGNKQLEKAIKAEKKGTVARVAKNPYDVPYKKYGRLETLAKKYEKSGNKQLDKAIKAEEKRKEKEAIKLLKSLNAPPTRPQYARNPAFIGPMKRRGRPPKNPM
jgi:hypothetical protein